MPFGNPAVGGIELVRNAISSPNYIQGQQGWKINRDGSAEFNNQAAFQTVSAIQEMYYKGDKLSTLLKQNAGGILSCAFLAAAARTFTTEKLLCQTSFVYQGSGREYGFIVRPFQWSSSAVPSECIIRFRYCAAGRNVALTDPGVIMDAKQNAISGYAPTIGGTMTQWAFDGLWSIGQQVNVAITIECFDNVGTHTFTGSTSDNIFFQVFDLGVRALAGTNSVDLYTAGTPVAKKFKTFSVNMVDSQSYIQSGAASNGSGSAFGTYMYFGQDPSFGGNGNWRSYAWPNKGDTTGGNGLGNLNDMVGIAAADIAYLDIYVDVPWWYQIAGGTLLVGMTGAAINHVSEPGGTYDIVEIGYGARGIGQWFSVLGSTIQTAILNGTWSGMVLGPGKTTALAWYGYAYGASFGNQGGPGIRAGYYK